MDKNKTPEPHVVEAVASASGSASARAVGEAVGSEDHPDLSVYMGGVEWEVQNLGAGDAAGGDSKPPRKRSTGTKIRSRGGVRTMKTYILTEDELTSLGQLRLAATVAFALGSGALGFWLSVTQGLAFSENIAPITRATWETWKTAALIGAGVSYAFGLTLTVLGFTRLQRIKSEMEHND